MRTMLAEFWDNISYLGLSRNIQITPSVRRIILTNRFAVFISMGSLAFAVENSLYGVETFKLVFPVVLTHFSVGVVLLVFIYIIGAINFFYTDHVRAETIIKAEHERSEKLLLNILPESIAKQLKDSPSPIAERFRHVTVLFADIVGFTPLSSTLLPRELVTLLDQIFLRFDTIVDKYQLEKIKTIGDAYMLAGGLPIPRDDHAEVVAQAALEMQDAAAFFEQSSHQNISIRIGIHTGEVVAGVIGKKKFAYDLWGDTVNIASRMESHGIGGKIQVSSETYELLKNNFSFEKRGVIQVKGKGEMETYFLIDKRM